MRLYRSVSECECECAADTGRCSVPPIAPMLARVDVRLCKDSTNPTPAQTTPQNRARTPRNNARTPRAMPVRTHRLEPRVPGIVVALRPDPRRNQVHPVHRVDHHEHHAGRRIQPDAAQCAVRRQRGYRCDSRARDGLLLRGCCFVQNRRSPRHHGSPGEPVGEHRGARVSFHAGDDRKRYAASEAVSCRWRAVKAAGGRGGKVSE